MKSARSIALEIVGHPNLMSRVGICDRGDLATAIEEAIVADRRERQAPVAPAVCAACGKGAA